MSNRNVCANESDQEDLPDSECANEVVMKMRKSENENERNPKVAHEDLADCDIDSENEKPGIIIQKKRNKCKKL